MTQILHAIFFFPPQKLTFHTDNLSPNDKISFGNLKTINTVLTWKSYNSALFFTRYHHELTITERGLLIKCGTHSICAFCGRFCGRQDKTLQNFSPFYT